MMLLYLPNKIFMFLHFLVSPFLCYYSCSILLFPLKFGDRDYEVLAGTTYSVYDVGGSWAKTTPFAFAT